MGGCLCLDFVNTVGGRDAAGAPLREKLAAYPDLLVWSAAAGDRRAAASLVPLARRNPAAAAAAMDRAIHLREALYRIFRCTMDQRRPKEPDLALLRDHLAGARAHQVFAAQGRAFAWIFPHPSQSFDRVLWPVALSAAGLLASPDLPKVRQCAGGDCGWLFLDTSRNRRRQWCDMRDCGNRAKVRRFRENRP